MKPARFLIVPVLALLNLLPPAVCKAATVDPPTPDDPSASLVTAPNPMTMQWALRAYDAERFADAAAAFTLIASGKSNEPEEAVRRAEFFLGKSYFNMKRYPESQAAFGKVMKFGRSHPYFPKMVQWLAALARFVPTSSGILELIGMLDKADAEQPALEPVRDELYFLFGQAHKHQGNQEEAREFFGKIPPTSPFYPRAQTFLSQLQPAKPSPNSKP